METVIVFSQMQSIFRYSSRFHSYLNTVAGCGDSRILVRGLFGFNRKRVRVGSIKSHLVHEYT